MRYRSRTFLCALTLSIGIFASGAVPAAQSPQNEIIGQVNALLSAYSRNDPNGVLHLLRQSEFAIYGSDAAEIVTTESGVRAMMRDDFKLWKTAQFGEIRDLKVTVTGELASAFFHVPFSAGGSPAVLVRFCTVWHRVRGKWELVMSANTVPTVGSSAAEILKNMDAH